ncbi:GNAT family N-acetyltransferase [Bacillus sp. SM2101]|uniref:GNAT family N-acetyltransferase n=1 Tax=Bacillus sp. SM2101 TaxID=2805366 RepID=UPI001BDDCB26|nr:GNAT family N-acetyltransferase [Bacillus sp. SM2101]
MKIVKASNSDVQTIFRHAKKVAVESTMGYAKGHEQHAVNGIKMALSNGYYLVAKEDHKLLGWVLVTGTIDSIKNTYIGYIADLYVLEEHRKKGIGNKLLKAGLNKCKQHGYKYVQLNVFAKNPAKNLYEEFGFEDLIHTMQIKL